MLVPLTTFVNAKDLDPATIKNVPHADLVQSLYDWLQLWTRRAIDFEILDYAGAFVAEAGFVGVDRDALAWYRQDPSLVRYEILAGFLWGYWKFAVQIDMDSLATLNAMAGKLPNDTWAYAVTLFALYSVASSKVAQLPPRERASLRAMLLQSLNILTLTGHHPGLAAVLEHLK